MYKRKSGHNEPWRGKFGVENWFTNNVFFFFNLTTMQGCAKP